MRVTKIKTYDITDCTKWHTTIGETIKLRKDLNLTTEGFDKCFACDKEFKPDDIPYIGFMSGRPNEFICESCAMKVKEEKSND